MNFLYLFDIVPRPGIPTAIVDKSGFGMTICFLGMTGDFISPPAPQS